MAKASVATAEALWQLADEFEQEGAIVQAIKCLEAICQAPYSFPPATEVRTRVRLACLLLEHTVNVNQATAHLERSQALLRGLPGDLEVKLVTHSLLSRCYGLMGQLGMQKQILNRALEFALNHLGSDWACVVPWMCNLQLQLASLHLAEGASEAALTVLVVGRSYADRSYLPGMKLLYAASILHAHLILGSGAPLLQPAIADCNAACAALTPEDMRSHEGLLVYGQVLQAIWALRTCDYGTAMRQLAGLDQALGLHPAATDDSPAPAPARQPGGSEPATASSHPHASGGAAEHSRGAALEGEGQGGPGGREEYSMLLRERHGASHLQVGPGPLKGVWLHRKAAAGLLHLMAAQCLRPGGRFKDALRRVQAGLRCCQLELAKLGITETSREEEVPFWGFWTVGLYLQLWVHLLEGKATIDLTRCEFTGAQEAIAGCLEVVGKFPHLLSTCIGPLHMLLGQYAHSVRCFGDADAHFRRASQVTTDGSLRAMCALCAALSQIGGGRPQALSQALDLVTPVLNALGAFPGSRERAAAFFISGLLLYFQNQMAEARERLSAGLKLTHKSLGNHQLVSQYMVAMGAICLNKGDVAQANPVLLSAQTLAKVLHDLPSLLAVLQQLKVLHQVTRDTAKALQVEEYERKKTQDLAERTKVATQSPLHLTLCRAQLLAEDMAPLR